MKIKDIINNVENESLALPVFQRGYVWKRPQVKDLMNSLYRGYPVGSLLTWTTQGEPVKTVGGTQVPSAITIDLILDGQQRVTSLYGVIKGKPPVFFEGDARAFEDMYFSLEHESFEFSATAAMANNPLWVKVTDLFQSGLSGLIEKLNSNPLYSANIGAYMSSAMKVEKILDVDLPTMPITGPDKTTDVVVDIFNRINQGGTKLSVGDLTLARICSRWPDARTEMQKRLSKWRSSGFDAKLDWLLRCMNATITGGAEFGRLDPENTEQIQLSLEQTEGAVDLLLESMRSHLFMDSNRLFAGKHAFSVMVKYLVENGGRFPNQVAMARLLHWYISVAIWGRFSGAVETALNQDLSALSEAEPVEALLRNLRVSQGERKVAQENFDMAYSTARFYPLLYIMSRVQDARDWGTGNQLRHHSLGSGTKLEMHHIFPKAYLRRNGVSAKDANNMGNIAFQTQDTNRAIGTRPPVDYMPEVEKNWPGSLESQWIPMNRELWKVENYRQFLEARRSLLADSANAMLNALRSGNIPVASPSAVSYQQGGTLPTLTPTSADPDDEVVILESVNSFVEERGMSSGEVAYEVFHEDTSEPVAVLDLAWPNGLQVGFSQPVALLIDDDLEVRTTASEAGFRVFTSADAFRRYVEREILAESG